MSHADSDMLPAAHHQLLVSTKFNSDGPGTILHDMGALLNFIEENPLPLTTSEQLALNTLSALNSRLAHPVQLGLKRPQQKSYPHIHGLYLLLRASGLGRIEHVDDKTWLHLDEDIYQQWLTLNLTEQYCTLLESWFLRGRPEIIGESPRPWDGIPQNFRHSAYFYSQIPSDGLVIRKKSDTVGFAYHPEWHNLGLLDLFGFIMVERADLQPGQGWQIKAIHRTAFGSALFAILHSGFFRDHKNILSLVEDDTPYEDKITIGAFQPVLQPYFTEWKNNLSLLSPQLFRAGAYTFKVSLGSVWRRIAIDGNQTMDDFALAILRSVNFDSDHLYEFSYRNRFGVQETIVHPYLDEGERFTPEVLIGDLPLQVGQTMSFLFDFGDNWRFDISLEQVDPDGDVKTQKIIERHGKAPEQYPILDE